MSPVFLNTRKVYFTGIIALVGMATALCLALAQQRSEGVALSNYHIYECDIDGAHGTTTFTFLTVSSAYAREMADSLCRSPVMARHYGKVRISWKPRGLLTAEQILSEEYDLIWSRLHNMRGLVPEFSSYYETLLRLDHYRVFWFSREQAPELSPQFFRGKKIGLLNDRLSHTHYLLPLASLKEVGIDFSSEHLVYFDDAMTMYRAFARGELDLISAGSWLQRDLDIPLYRTLIAGNATAATLFIRKRRNRAVDCEVAAALGVFGSTLADTQMHFAEAHHCDDRS